MAPLTDPFRKKLVEDVLGQIHKTFELALEPADFVADLALAPSLKMGHFAFPCFKFSKGLKKSPKDIASALAESWQEVAGVVKVEAAGPYLNLFLSAERIALEVLSPMAKGPYFDHQPGESARPYLIEYSQPNTHKELHVGHMRNLCYGLSLIELFRYCGNKVVSCTFPGDVGTHVAKCLWYLKTKNKEAFPQENKGQWLGAMYTKANTLLEEQKGTDQEDNNRQELTEVLRQLEQQQGDYFELWRETRQWSLDLMNEVYKWAGVSFDRWFWESEVDAPSTQLVKSLHAQGKLVEDNGAVGLNLEDEKLGFCMFLKSDGNGLYSTKDLELARRKFEEFNPEKNIVVVDVRQELHFKQVFSAFEKLGLGETSRCLHLKYNFVELPDGAMSSRKGNIVPIMDLIKQMKATIRQDYLQRYVAEWSEDEIEKTADMVAQGAIKYGMNRMDPNKKIVFDMKDWLRLDGESGPYIQYSHARLSSLLKKFGEPAWDNLQWDLLQEDSEIELMLHLSTFQISMSRALTAYKTSSICSYVYELAKKVNSFYQACPIGKLEDQALKDARLALVQATKIALKQGLSLLGIPAPEKM